MDLPPNRIGYLPMVDRPTVSWPDGARVAFWVAPNVEHYEYLPPRDPRRNPWPRSPHPDVQGYAHRDYGNRVGFWRMLDVLDSYNVRCTASTNLAVFDHYPQIGKAMADRGWEIMSHGIYNTRYLSSLSESEEQEFYVDCVASLRRHTGQELRGMLGPAVSNTARTPDLMAEAGLTYHADWLHDDQPVPIKVRNGKLISVPYSIELNDVPVFLQHHDPQDFVTMVKNQFDTLYEEGSQSGRVMALAIHPYLMGMPHRIDALDEMLDYVLGHDGVWQPTASEIADHFIEHNYDSFVAHAAHISGEPNAC
tara:strand:+ start:542 stop:1465 length:924 start_codon:yes stop_codon:yes gene_type:complete